MPEGRKSAKVIFKISLRRASSSGSSGITSSVAGIIVSVSTMMVGNFSLVGDDEGAAEGKI